MIVGCGLRQLHTWIANCESFSVYGTSRSMWSYTGAACGTVVECQMSFTPWSWSPVTADTTVCAFSPLLGSEVPVADVQSSERLVAVI